MIRHPYLLFVIGEGIFPSESGGISRDCAAKVLRVGDAFIDVVVDLIAGGIGAPRGGFLLGIHFGVGEINAS